ncbi:MAG TPA: VCBS repeat-containing protein [Oligoflexia bacterium]|nr:VCBS repeat-containing protein [Oligoflexia bacterium]HMP48993.1 VCBS repeat-containing protein [Oligoflexia bacterium]
MPSASLRILDNRLLFFASPFFILNIFLLNCVFAQSFSLTSPVVATDYPEGDDYFTDVLLQPADGLKRRMIAWDHLLRSEMVDNSDGIWKASGHYTDYNLFPVFPGFKGALSAEPLPGDRELPKMAIRHPIDSAKYTHLSYRMFRPRAGPLTFFWDFDTSRPLWWPAGDSMRAGIPVRGPFFFNGWETVILNMAEPSQFTNYFGSWSGQIYSLRIDPKVLSDLAADNIVEIDWMRLSNPDSAPKISIKFESNTLTSNHLITIYHDSKNHGYSGNPVYSYYYNGRNEYVIPSASLPPGDHYFYVEIQEYSRGLPVGQPRRSTYSAKQRIIAKPVVTIFSPAPDSGESYSFKARGREWDMAPESDSVANLNPVYPQVLRQFVNHSYIPNSESKMGGHVFQAMAEPAYQHLGHSESDVQVHLSISPNQLIDPSYYRYFVYRMAVGEDGYPSIHDKVQNGWVSRVIAYNDNVLVDRMVTKGHIVYEGWKTYWFDLDDADTLETGFRWSSFKSLKNLRLDPGEFNIPGKYTWFMLDFVKLHAENRAFNDSFEIRFSLSSDTASSLNVSLYYDIDQKDFNGTLIKKLEGLSSGNHIYKWDTSGLPPGQKYFVYLLVDDGLQEAKTYSSVHVRTLGSSLRNVSDWNYLGDNSDDHVVFRPSNGSWYLKSSSGEQHGVPFGASSHYPIRGDFDGDGSIDSGLVTLINGAYHFFIRYSSTGALYSRAWGRAGDYFVINDFNNNGRDEIAVWRPSEGNWYILDEEDKVLIVQWGLPGDIPVPADYNGDGKLNLAVWRPSSGTWWVRESMSSGSGYSVTQWGLPGDIPITSWYGAEAKPKYVIWRPIEGNWYILDPDTSGVIVKQWGLSGDIPLAGDFDNDGLSDFTVFRKGFWYHQFRNGQIKRVGWGLPGDLVPTRVGILE